MHYQIARVPLIEAYEEGHVVHESLSCSESIPGPFQIQEVVSLTMISATITRKIFNDGILSIVKPTSTTHPRPVVPKVSIAYISPSSMRVASPPHVTDTNSY